MRPILGLLLASTLLLAGCGDDTGDTQVDGTPQETSSETSSASSTPSNGPVEALDVAVVSQTDVGGRVDEQAVELGDEAAEADFLAQFDGDRMAQALDEQTAAIKVGDGQAMVAAVVAIGCTPPTDVTLERTDAGLQMTAAPSKADGNVECFAPVTSVAVAVVDAAQL